MVTAAFFERERIRLKVRIAVVSRFVVGAFVGLSQSLRNAATVPQPTLCPAFLPFTRVLKQGEAGRCPHASLKKLFNIQDRPEVCLLTLSPKP